MAGQSADGLTITAGGSTVRGLDIERFSGSGIVLAGFGGDTVEGNYIGVDATGTIAQANGGAGVTVRSGNNTIGGTAPATRNVISSNTGYGIDISGKNTLVEGNYIGTNATGAAALPNISGGIHIVAPNVTVGGTHQS